MKNLPMTLGFSLGAALALIVIGPARADDKPKGDLAKLQGKWVARPVPGKDLSTNLLIEGSNCTATYTSSNGGGGVAMSGKIKVDETAKPHKTIDFTGFKQPNGEDMEPNRGIYQIQADGTVKLCTGGPGRDRPTEFKSAEGGPELTTLAREGAAAPTPTTETTAPAAEKDAPAPATEEAKGDLTRFQGDWTTRVDSGGDTVDVSVNFKGSAVTIHFVTPEGEDRTMKGEAAIDETAKPHRAITFKKFTRADGTEAPENQGIYAFEGDDLAKLCTGGPGNARPTEFKGGEGGQPQLIELKRKKN